MILSLDIETKSRIDLTKSGVYPYVEDESFEILLIAYAFDEEEVQVIDLASGTPLPSQVKEAILDNTVIKTAFNANFERVCLEKYLNTKLDIASFKCTQAKAMRLGLPSNLQSVAKALQLPLQKLDTGKSLIKYFNTHSKDEDLSKWEEFKTYCKIDCEVERAIRKKLLVYEKIEHKTEEQVYILDQIINDRGVSIDTKLIDQAIKLNTLNEEIKINHLKKISNIQNIKSTLQVKNYLKENYNLHLDSISKSVIDNLLDTTQDQDLKNFLKLRQELNKTSIKKYIAMKNTHTKDNTIKGLFKYYGATKTGRWSGRLVQVQNLPNSTDKDLDLIRTIVKNSATKDSYNTLELLDKNINQVLTTLIRSVFIPKDNHKFIISDFSAIEARVLAYLARETWRLEVFDTHGKIYEASAAKMFNKDIDEISKDSQERQMGKIAELALGYQGGVNALKVMGGQKAGLKEDTMKYLVTTFRKSNPNIVNFWKNIEALAIRTIMEKRNFTYNDLDFIYHEDYLFIKLPSNRKLAYYKPNIEIDPTYDRYVLTYMSTNQTTKKFEKTYTYGGKLTENIVQGLSRDLLAHKMLQLNHKGYFIIMHIHDEVVLEVDNSVTISQINEIMEAPIPYIQTLNLKADTKEAYYYQK